MTDEVSPAGLRYKRRRGRVSWILSREENHGLPTRNKGPESFVALFNLGNSPCPFAEGVDSLTVVGRVGSLEALPMVPAFCFGKSSSFAFLQTAMTFLTC